MNRKSLYLIPLIVVAACTPAPQESADVATAPAPPGSFKPLNDDTVVFWGRFTAEIEELQKQMTAEFNETNPGTPVKVEYAGGYGEIFKKSLAAIHAKQLPAMAMAYESMTSEYIASESVAQLGDYMRDPELGFAFEDLDDFFPELIETNKFDQFDGRMYSFPFAKSTLMLYYNKRVLAAAGHDSPPKTWDEFLQQCRDVKEKAGKQALAANVDCSTVSGMIFSHGGEVFADGQYQYDSAASIAVFELFETLFKEDLAFQTQRGSYDDQVAFGNDEVAFVLRTSASRTGLGDLMEWDESRWGIAPLPQADPENPSTVMFGPNIVIFAVGEEQQKRAWSYVRWFTNKENTVRWALGTGYLPIRKSAEESEDMQAFWAEWPDNRAAFDSMSYAKAEPNVNGWQEVRGLVEQAQVAIFSSMQSAEEAAKQLQADAQQVLSSQ